MNSSRTDGDKEFQTLAEEIDNIYLQPTNAKQRNNCSPADQTSSVDDDEN